MTADPAQPRPGGAAAFRQRYQAYGLLARIADEVGAAQSALDNDKPADAAARLGDFLQRVEQNPAALEMLAARQPAALAEARSLYREAAAQADTQVTRVSQGEWLTYDGLTETRLDLGVSARGHHFSLEISERGGEHDARWSRPYPTAEAAHQAGQAAQDSAHGMTDEPAPAVATARNPAPTPVEQQPDNERTAPSKVAAIRESQTSTDIWADRDIAGRTARERDSAVQGQAPGPSQRRGMRHAAE
jgi:hypothetical protein